MNPFLNPLFSLRMLKRYLTDLNRAWEAKPDEIKKYQDKALQRTLKYAYRVPVYLKKYRTADIHPSDISGIEDLHKLPLVTREDLVQGFPNEIVPLHYKKTNAYLISTSGCSGMPLSMFKDMEYITIEAIAAVRVLKAYGLSWRKTRITNIGDFSLPKSTDEECLKNGLFGNLSLFFSFNNYQNLYTGEEVGNLLKKMDTFDPETIIGYTSVLMGIAFLKRNGFGKNVNPQYIISSGEILDPYSRKYIEEAFNTNVLDLYATTEGGVIAFECLQKKLHINSDFIHVEVLDKNGEPVEKKLGSVVTTRLYPGGTPIIRYIGLNDIAVVGDSYCDCGMHTPILKHLEGRKNDAIFLPDGRIFPPATISMIFSDVAIGFKTYQIKRFQFIQRKIDEIEICLEIDDEQKDKTISMESLLEEIRKRYQRLIGNTVRIYVKEVKEVEIPEGQKSPPLIISKLNKKRIEETFL
jgi:phenylacetate-CoA ligase